MIKQEIYSTIPLTNVVVDNLHMFVRISDVLIDLLIVNFVASIVLKIIQSREACLFATVGEGRRRGRHKWIFL